VEGLEDPERAVQPQPLTQVNMQSQLTVLDIMLCFRGGSIISFGVFYSRPLSLASLLFLRIVAS
jgi:hypothetical protein